MLHEMFTQMIFFVSRLGVPLFQLPEQLLCYMSYARWRVAFKLNRSDSFLTYTAHFLV